MKKSILYVLLLSLAVVTVVGVVIGATVLNGKDNITDKTTVELNGQTTNNLAIKLDKFHPGDKYDYTITLNANKGDKYNVQLDFVTTGEKTLAPFIDVNITLAGKTIASGKLTELLDGESINFDCDFASQTAEIKVEYAMDINVGDEAQNTIAQFDIKLTAKM